MTTTQQKERWMLVVTSEGQHVVLHEVNDDPDLGTWWETAEPDDLITNLFASPDDWEVVSAHETEEEARTALKPL